MSSGRDESTMVLFDVDGTLTKPRNPVTDDMLQALEQLRERVKVALVGGSRIGLIEEQMGAEILRKVDYVFAENGLSAYRHGELFASTSIKETLGEQALQRLINECLYYIAALQIPHKRGTFIEFRTGMLNVSPIGRNCTQEERDAFEQYDKQHHVRRHMIEHLQQRLPDLPLVYSIGGQISFDVMPIGWTKEYTLRYLPDTQYRRIVFFGDKCYPGGNDWEIYSHARVEGHAVSGPDDTRRQVHAMFLQEQR